MNNRLLLSAIALMAAVSSALPVTAEDASTSAAASSPASESSATSGSATPTFDAQNGGQSLSGQVQLVEVNLATLRDLGLDIKRVQHGATSLYDEVSRQPVSLQTMPEVVGLNTVIPVVTGFTGGGYLPPRKSAVDNAMGAIEPWIDLAKSSVDAITEGHKKLNLDEATQVELAPQFKKWSALVNDTYGHLQVLKGLTKGPVYDNQSIAQQATAINREAKDLEKVRRDIYKVLQREGKEARKSKKN